MMIMDRSEAIVGKVVFIFSSADGSVRDALMAGWTLEGFPLLRLEVNGSRLPWKLSRMYSTHEEATRAAKKRMNPNEH